MTAQIAETPLGKAGSMPLSLIGNADLTVIYDQKTDSSTVTFQVPDDTPTRVQSITIVFKGEVELPQINAESTLPVVIRDMEREAAHIVDSQYVNRWALPEILSEDHVLSDNYDWVSDKTTLTMQTSEARGNEQGVQALIISLSGQFDAKKQTSIARSTMRTMMNMAEAQHAANFRAPT